MDMLVTSLYLISAACFGIALAMIYRRSQAQRAELAYERHVAKLQQRQSLERVGIVRSREREFGRNV